MGGGLPKTCGNLRPESTNGRLVPSLAQFGALENRFLRFDFSRHFFAVLPCGRERPLGKGRGWSEPFENLFTHFLSLSAPFGNGARKINEGRIQDFLGFWIFWRRQTWKTCALEISTGTFRGQTEEKVPHCAVDS